MAEFDPALRRVLELEGGYGADVSDRGGKTRFGITEAVARENGYEGDMRTLPLKFAEEIYRTKFWSPMRLSAVKDQEIAEELFDSAVNCGVSRAVKWLQTALNALNDGGRRWPDVGVDGAMGAKTLEALELSIARKQHAVRLCKAMNCLQGSHYLDLVRRDPSQERFVGGWLDKRVVL